MSRTSSRWLTAVGAATVAACLTACGEVDLADTESRPVDEVEESIGTDADHDGGDDADPDPEEAVAAGELDLTYDLDVRSPDGLRVQVSALRAVDEVIELDVRIANRTGNRVELVLDCGTAPLSSVLTDDLGNVHRIAFHEDGEPVCTPTLDHDGILEGTLAFRGPLSDDADRVSWFVRTWAADREEVPADEIRASTSSPAWRIDLPLSRG